MAVRKISEVIHFGVGIAPVADVFDSTQYSDVVNLQNFGKVAFVVFTGVGATGTQTFTVEACDDVVPTNVSAVAFYSRSYYNSDVPGALTSQASAGYTVTAGSNAIHVIEIDVEALIASGYKYARMKSVEVTNSPVLGGILTMLLDPRSTEHVGLTTIV